MYQPTIGLEIHAGLKTKSKMFCSSANNPDEQKPNTNICPICMGHPGILPVINEEAVRKVIKIGSALNCEIAECSKFDRKNYFYPDLPKGYQISQYDMPLCKKGYLKVGDRKIKITRIHLEEDAGKLIHSEKENCSFVDFNRAGIPLMELVTEPEIYSSAEARKFAEELRLILKYLDISDANMEKGQMRVEVNISIKKAGDSGKLGTKVEIKNLNSFRSVEKAVEYEIKRQTKVLQSGGKIAQETRGWHDNKEITISQRSKEEAYDYRYFPEPDLSKFYLTKNYIEKIKSKIPELPQSRRRRFEEEYGLDKKNIEVFVVNKYLGEYFEQVVSELINWMKHEGEEINKEKSLEFIKLACNCILSDFQALLKKASDAGNIVNPRDFITPENFAEFVKMIYKKEISSKIAKTVIVEMFKTGADPSHIIEEKDLSQITDENEIVKAIDKVITLNKSAAEDFKNGKDSVLQFLIGQVMTNTRGKADPVLVSKILRKKLQ